MTAEDINIGIGALLETFEMAYVVFYLMMKSLVFTLCQDFSLSCTSVHLPTSRIGECMNPIQVLRLQNALRA